MPGNNEPDDSIPLMIKKYETGKLTPLLINNQKVPDSLTISCPRGQGLKLESLSPGRVVFVAGGTGFYPYMDIIDLLFKQRVIEEKQYSEAIRSKILNLNPIIRETMLKEFIFTIYLAIVSVEDLHPMSLYQINALCKSSGRFNCIMRLKEGREDFQKKYKSIDLTSDHFDELVLADAKKDETTKVYICGPPAMNTNVAKKLL